MSKMSVNLAGVTLKNPVMTASGTFGSGAEYSEFVDLNNLGAAGKEKMGNFMKRKPRGYFFTDI